MEKVKLTLQQIQAFYNLLQIDGGDVYITLPQEVKSNVNMHTIMYKCFCLMSKKEVAHVKRGEIFVTVVVHFNTVEDARKNSNKALKMEEAVLLPPYMERRTSCIKIEEVPPKANVGWVIATLL